MPKIKNLPNEWTVYATVPLELFQEFREAGLLPKLPILIRGAMEFELEYIKK